MTKWASQHFAFLHLGEEINEEFGVSLPFVYDIVSGLTTGQASALYYSLLKNLTKKEIASVMGQTSQNVSRLLILAKEKQIRNLINRFRTVITSSGTGDRSVSCPFGCNTVFNFGFRQMNLYILNNFVSTTLFNLIKQAYLCSQKMAL